MRAEQKAVWNPGCNLTMVVFRCRRLHRAARVQVKRMQFSSRLFTQEMSRLNAR